MYKIITANNVEFTDPEGSFTLSKDDTVNEYKGEDGQTTLEIIREGQISATVSYNSLSAETIKKMADALTTVTEFKLYDALTDSQKTITARVSGVKVKKNFYRDNISMWSLSFDIDEL